MGRKGDLANLLDMLDRLPNTFHRDCAESGFGARDELNEYLIATPRSPKLPLFGNGFFFYERSRAERSWRQHCFAVCTMVNGLPIGRSLQAFGSTLEERERSGARDLCVSELKRGFLDCRDHVDFIENDEHPEPNATVREALIYVFASAGLTGSAGIILGEPFLVTHEWAGAICKLVGPLPRPFDNLKPALNFGFLQGQLLTLGAGSLDVDAPNYSPIDRMKAVNRLSQLGLSDGDINGLDELITELSNLPS